MPLAAPTKENIRFCPLISLWMGNQQILQECGQFIIHYLQITKSIYHIVNIFENYSVSKLTLYDTKLTTEIVDLEIYCIRYNPDETTVQIPEIENDPIGHFLNYNQEQSQQHILHKICTYYCDFYAQYIIDQRWHIQLVNRKRYNLFKSALFLSLKAKEFKYEDHLRSLFGKHGFIFSTLEKVLHDAAKQLTICSSDLVTINYFEKSISFSGDIDKQFQVVSGKVNGEGIKVSDLESEVYYQFETLKEEKKLLKLHDTLQHCKPEKKPINRIACRHKACFISMLPGYGGHTQVKCTSWKQHFLLGT